MVMALAGNKADLVEARKVAAEVIIIFCHTWFFLHVEFYFTPYYLSIFFLF